MATLLPFSAAHAALCTPGHYSSTGSDPCATAPVGTYVNSAGATSVTLAPVGRYVPTSGATTSIPAPVGS
ncbi:hypothetical protein [Roseateles sp. BYS78W]|uniref:hypothetical protein n=1 Tax=Pelomonas candidula TaxID=3299025 RepID=UPI0037488C8D